MAVEQFTPYQIWLMRHFTQIFLFHKSINKAITGVLLGIIAFGILGNIFAAVFFFRHRAGWHKHNYLQFLLALVNAAMLTWEFLNRLSNFLIYELLALFGDFSWKWPNCMIMTFYSVALKSFSMTLLLCIAVDRLLALFAPFSYATSGLKHYWLALGILGGFQVLLSGLRQGTIFFMQYNNNATGIRGASCLPKKDPFSYAFNKYFEVYYYYAYLGGIAPCVFLGVCNCLLAVKVHRILANRKRLSGASGGVSNKNLRSAIITAVFCTFLVLCKLPHVIVRLHFRDTLNRTAPQTFFERNFFRSYVVIVFLNKSDAFFWLPETITSFYALADASFVRSKGTAVQVRGRPRRKDAETSTARTEA